MGRLWVRLTVVCERCGARTEAEPIAVGFEGQAIGVAYGETFRAFTDGTEVDQQVKFRCKGCDGQTAKQARRQAAGVRD